MSLVAATAVSTLIVVLALAVLAALTLVPFVLALRLAERRGYAQARWGALALAGSVLGAAVLLLALRIGGGDLLAGAAVGVLLAYAVPLLLRLVALDPLVSGRPGRHE